MERAPFSQGVLVTFRAWMIAHDLDRTLLARTIALVKRTGKFGWQRSPHWRRLELRNAARAVVPLRRAQSVP